MSTTTLYFTGKTKWAKVRKPDEKYDTYQVPLYMSSEEFDKYKKSGIQLKIREDQDGKFVVFKRRHAEFNTFLKKQIENGPPDVLLNGEPWDDGLVGNGSEVIVKVQVYDTPRRGPGTKGHRLLSLNVTNLVEYQKPEQDSEIKMPF